MRRRSRSLSLRRADTSELRLRQRALRDGSRRGAPQPVEDEAELAAPDLGRDVAGKLDQPVARPEHQWDVLRGEVRAKCPVLLSAGDEPRDEGPDPPSHRRGALAT